MKFLIILFIIFLSVNSFADDFVCMHSDSYENYYRLKNENGALCITMIDSDGQIIKKIQLLETPLPEVGSDSVVYSSYDGLFEIELNQMPTPSRSSVGELFHLGEDGVTVLDKMNTECYYIQKN